MVAPDCGLAGAGGARPAAGRAQAPAVAWLEKVRFCERIPLTSVGDTCMVTVT